MKIYIAGPMSGLPQFNYPAFDAAADALRGEGHTVVSPAEMDSPEVRKLALASTKGNLSELESSGETWGDMLAADVKLIADDVDAVAVLQGWEKSRGARLEAFVALSVMKPVYFVNKKGVARVADNESVLKGISYNVIKQGNVDRYKETVNES